MFGAAPHEEKIQYVTFSKKAMYSITQGVNFVQVDLESMSEFKEPDIKQNIEKVKRLGISFGVHGETGAFGGGREVPLQLDSAYEEDYSRSHARLIEVLTQAGEIGSKYFLIHASESYPLILTAKTLEPARLVDVQGRGLDKFFEDNPDILDWAANLDLIRMLGLHLSDYMERYAYNNLQQVMNKKIRSILSDSSIPDEKKKDIVARAQSETLTPEDILTHEEIERAKKDGMKRIIQQYVVSRDIDYGPERFAYFIIAKWMETRNDPLWKPIIKVSLKFYLKEGEVEKIGKLSVENPKFYERFELWVPAVAAKYLWGHFNPDPKYEDPKKILEKYEMYLTIEPPMASPGMENLMRLANPVHFYYLVKNMGFKYFRMAIDIEHILGNYLDPQKVIEELPDDGGNFIKVIHAGWPTSIQPAHMPILVGSEQHIYLYKQYFELRKKGMGKDEDVFIIYERGNPHIQQSIIALKLIVKFLENDVSPDRLPLEFFGLDVGQLASSERQWVQIEEHARDPLKGLMIIPEEEYGFLGTAAVQKGKTEIWKKEELK